MFVCFLSGLTLGNLPFNVIQMLWLNLVMDILAAISIGTDPYKKDAGGRVSRKFRVFVPEMWRAILAQFVYQALTLLTLVYFGGLMFYDGGYNLVTTNARDPRKVKVDTFIFHTFFMMTMFNQICCKITDDQGAWNILGALCNNPMFWFIWAFEMGLQHLFLYWSNYTKLGGKILGMSALSVSEQAICWLLGALVVGVHFGAKLIKIDGPIPFEAINDKVDLESDETNTIVETIFNKIYTCLKLNKKEGDDTSSSDSEQSRKRRD